MYKLIIEDDEGKTTVVPLIRDEITIGRKEGNTIRLTERNISRRHAKLLKQNGSVYIEDLGSYNGIRVNGAKIAGRMSVAEGDRIQIGDYLLALKVDRAHASQNRTGEPFASDVRTQPMDRPDVETLARESSESLRAALPVGSNGASSVQAAAVPVPAAPVAPPVVLGEALPEDALDIAPTTPVVTQPERPARLVVLSSNFAGQEFLLDKNKLVIGRVDDNDIVVNHRSISRHHAAVVREHGRYNIVDLQSANGVRVNGEEYGKVELRRGDVIDLGHVRLRFVEPGEDFVFDRDATVVDMSPGGWRTLSPPLMVFVLLLAAALTFFIFRDRLLGHIGGGSAVDAQVATLPVGPPTPSADLNVGRALAEINQALKEERWEDAIARCDELLKQKPDDELARDRRQRAEAEKKNKDAFTRYQQALAGHDADAAVGAYNEIADDSVYKERARQTFAEVREKYVQAHLARVQELAGQGHCTEARREADQVLVVDEHNTRASELVRRCQNRVAAAPGEKPAAPVGEKPPHEKTAHDTTPPPTTRPPRPPREHPVVVEKERPPAPDPAEADALAQQAQDAYVKGQYGLTIELCNKALKINKRQPLAVRIMGAAYCKLRNKDGAVRAFGQAEPQFRGFIKFVCHTEGVELP
jgi:pSer/pThr/pTyr-binding forkhead associated (FHA) protein